MFQPQPFDLKSFVEKCKKDYGVSPHTHWISTYYGGQVCTFCFHLNNINQLT
jgi:hypothetical protein